MFENKVKEEVTELVISLSITYYMAKLRNKIKSKTS